MIQWIYIFLPISSSSFRRKLVSTPNSLLIEYHTSSMDIWQLLRIHHPVSIQRNLHNPYWNKLQSMLDQKPNLVDGNLGASNLHTCWINDNNKYFIKHFTNYSIFLPWFQIWSCDETAYEKSKQSLKTNYLYTTLKVTIPAHPPMLGKITAAAIFTAGFDKKSSVVIVPLIILIPKSANNYYYSALNLIKIRKCTH